MTVSKKNKPLLIAEVYKDICDRDRIRTCDRLLRRQMLYPAELLDHLYHGANVNIFELITYSILYLCLLK